MVSVEEQTNRDHQRNMRVFTKQHDMQHASVANAVEETCKQWPELDTCITPHLEGSRKNGDSVSVRA